MLEKIKLIRQRIMLKNNNPGSLMKLKSLTNTRKIKIGKGTYGDLNVIGFSENDGNLKIGNYCSIAQHTYFLLGGEHDYRRVSTYPFKARYLNKSENSSKGNIIVKDDVWIGFNCTILSGVTIGQGAVIGANSIVAKDVPPYAIYVGNQVIKYRFNKEIIEKLLKIDYSKLSKESIEQNVNELYTHIEKENVDEVIRSLGI